jgi:hypothetical protein
MRAFALCALWIVGCVEPSTGVDAAVDADDACGECDDGLFCNGVESCGEDGCQDGDAPCGEGACDEELDACGEDPCTIPDADGDGDNRIDCGGADCDDDDASVSSLAVEMCDDVDDDCDPTTFGDRDADDDGEISSECCNGDRCGEDCDDSRAGVNTSAPEVCNMIDDNCDGLTDEDVLRTFYPDCDGDGAGDETATPVTACAPPTCMDHNHVENDNDCDDTSRTIGPTATEVCDGENNDCDASVDEAGERVWYRDRDLDGRGSPDDTIRVLDCSMPAGYVSISGDCNDASDTTYVGAPELCNGIDDDCSLAAPMTGGADAAEDMDGDFHSARLAACNGGPFPKDDCDDARAATFPGADERCNRIDDNCSLPGLMAGTVDLDEDADADMHAPIGASCSGGFARDDCNDGNAAIHPMATEVCDRVDSNCSLASGAGGTDIGEDADGDMHAPTSATCVGGYPRDDCNDAAASTYPGAPESCDRLDTNCSLPSGAGGVDVAEDADNDMHAPTSATCVGGFPRDDCDDTRAAVYTGNAEICDGLDNDCDGQTDEPPAATSTCGLGRICRAGACDGVAQVSVGGQSSCALMVNGSVRCWGANGSSQLGDTTTTTRTLPVSVVGLPEALTSIDVGPTHVCGRTASNGVVCWGNGAAPALLPALVGVAQIVSDRTDTLSGADQPSARLTSGAGRTFATTGGAPSNISWMSGAIEMAQGSQVRCAAQGGVVRCSGYSFGPHASCGNGTLLTNMFCDANVTGIGVTTDIAMGDRGGCVIQSGGVRCWGHNFNGQVGDGSVMHEDCDPATGWTDCARTPVVVSGITTATSITAGHRHRCALLTDGSVRCWGYNQTGACGNGRTITGAPFGETTPVTVLLPSRAVQIASGGNHNCAILENGDVYCWGQNFTGQLGNGTMTSASTPVQVISLP